jgi:hypothetical protein
MRSFYLAYRDILQTASGESGPDSLKVQTLSGFSVDINILASIAACFPLPWSHYVRLLAVRNQNAREFYAAEAPSAVKRRKLRKCMKKTPTLAYQAAHRWKTIGTAACNRRQKCLIGILRTG